ncbi:MAG: hypothetical protein GY941_08325 [Planctomycetes bacterium]|nr:hypothetical protein [Planctomycetota bacterium]
MNTQADKTQENKSHSVTNGIAQTQSSSESAFQFVDNRPETIAQRKLQEMAINCPQVKQEAQLQAMADNYSARRSQPMQKKEAAQMGARAFKIKGFPSSSLFKPPLGNAIQFVNEEFQESIPSTALVVNEDVLPNKMQIRKDTFLAALKTEIRTVADQVLIKVNQSSSDCPYISYWFNYYQSRSSEHLLKAIEKYAPAASNAKTWPELIQIVKQRVLVAFTNYTTTGTLEDVPEEIPKGLVVQEQVDTLKEVGQLKSDIAQFCQGFFGGGATKYIPLQEDNNLPDWDGAIHVGYHTTSNWKEVRSSGVFKPGGGRLGEGIYVGKAMARIYGMLAKENSKHLEVGYIGDQSAWKRNRLQLSEYVASMEGEYDVLEIPGSMGQTCFKSNGPSEINFSNFRVRPKVNE